MKRAAKAQLDWIDALRKRTPDVKSVCGGTQRHKPVQLAGTTGGRTLATPTTATPLEIQLIQRCLLK